MKNISISKLWYWAYDKSVFDISEHFLVVSFKFSEDIEHPVEPPVKHPVEHPVEHPVDNLHDKILEFCRTEKSKQEIAAELGFKDSKGLVKRHLKPLVEQGKLSLTVPDKPASSRQKYITSSNI